MFACVCVPYVLLAWRLWFITDDAFISFRYARNLALGNGLRFNLWDRPPVEGYSNFLWVILCSLFEFLRLDVTWWPALISLACGGVILWLVLRVLTRHLEVALPAAGLATLALACFPPFAMWASSGLATMPFALLVLVTFERLVLRPDGPDPVGGALAGLALALIRVEGIAWFVVIFLLALGVQRMRGRRAPRPLLVCAAIVTAGYAAYFAWRYAYYGLPLPNTAYAKADLDPRRLGRGVSYVASFVLTFVSPIVLLPAAWVALRPRRRTVGFAIAAMAFAFPAYSVIVTGDFMAMGRFLVPGFAFGAILLAWLLEDTMARGTSGRAVGVAVSAAAIVLALLPAWNVHVVPQSIRERFRFRFNTANYETEYEQWQSHVQNAADWARRGRALRRYADERDLVEATPSCVAGAIGAIGYYSGYNIYDMHGLVTPEVARRAVAPEEPLRSPGHDKRVPIDFFLPCAPTVLDAWVVGPAGAPEVAAACGRKARALRERGFAEHYVVDWLRIDGDAKSGRYLIVWVRIRGGVSAPRAWGQFRDRLRDLALGGD